jgi:hypothetical protein
MITRHTPLCPQDLPGWVISAGDPLAIWHNGHGQLLSSDWGRALDVLGAPMPRTERLADALAPWYGVPPSHTPDGLRRRLDLLGGCRGRPGSGALVVHGRCRRPPDCLDPVYPDRGGFGAGASVLRPPGLRTKTA